MASPKYLHIEAIQSIIPGKVAEPGQSRKINLGIPLSNEMLQSHLRIVLYYKSDRHDSGEHNSALSVAAWAKETMSVVLSEHPVLAGRLRRDQEGDGYWEVKFNDAGVRMVQATAEVGMDEWLEMEGSREGREGVLAYWMDVDREHPEMSALFYIQVTKFQGDGYSIGFSCSLLLADPMFLTQFLKKWTIAHNSMLGQPHPETPIFHLGYFTKTNRPNHLKSIPLYSTPATNPPTTTLFKLDHASNLAQMLKATLKSKFSLLVHEPSQLKVESWKHEELVGPGDDFNGSIVNLGCLDEYFGLNDLALDEGNKPVSASCRVMLFEHDGIVVVMPPSNDAGDPGVLVSITVPNEN